MTPTQEARIREALEAAYEFANDRADTIDNDDGPPLPNEAMQLLHTIGAVLSDLEKQSSGHSAQAAAGGVPPGYALVPVEPTDEMVKVYLAANNAYWGRMDDIETKPWGKWRAGTPGEATAESLRAMLAAVGTVSPVTPRSDEKDVLAGVDPSGRASVIRPDISARDVADLLALSKWLTQHGLACDHDGNVGGGAQLLRWARAVEAVAHGVKTCADCQGSGSCDSGGALPWGEAAMVPCPDCNGTGEVFTHADDCDDDMCALNGDQHSCDGKVERCYACGVEGSRNG